MKQLRTWLDQNAQGRTFQLGYFGLYPPDAYGISDQGLNVPELMRGPKPDLYVLSAHFVAFLPAIGAKVHPGDDEWLRQVPVTIRSRLQIGAYWLKGTSTESCVSTGFPVARGTVVFHFRAAFIAELVKPKESGFTRDHAPTTAPS